MKIKLKALLLSVIVLVSLLVLASCTGGNGDGDGTGEAPHEHTYSTEWTLVKHATADTDGIKKNVCDTCDETVEAAIEKHEHAFSGAWKIITAATALKNGEASNSCTVCKFTVTRELPFCAIHTFSGDWTITKQPTKESTGLEKNNCDVCGGTVSRACTFVEKVEILTLPTSTFYFTNRLFSPSGLTIKVTYKDGSCANITSGWETLTTEKLHKDITAAKMSYKGFAFEIPIEVSPAIYSSLSMATAHPDGTDVFVEGVCAGIGTQTDGTKYYIIKDGSTVVLLKGIDYDYKLKDKINVYATVETDLCGKYLRYSSENESPESTVASANNYISPSLPQTVKTVVSEEIAESIFSLDLKRYEAVTFTGKFYLVKSGSNYRIHFNSNSTDAYDSRLPSGKIITLSLENIGDQALANRLTLAQLTSYPGALVSGSISAVFIENDYDNFYLQVLSADWNAVDPYTVGEEYARELAYAFYYQLPYVDYEQYNVRRNMNVTPEDATSQQRIYLDCSSYVNSVYYNAFGVNVLPYAISQKSANTANYIAYARENPNAIDVLGYWESRDYDTEEDREALLSELLKNLRVGDVIVYRKGNIETLAETAGHALIYVGGGKILHCTNTESYEHNGTNPDAAYDMVDAKSIATETTFNLFENTAATRYLFKYVNFTILRPLNRGLTPTAQTLARMQIPGLSIEKLLDKKMNSAVFKDDLLTYTITLNNNGVSDLTNVNVAEFVPVGTEFVSATGGLVHNAGNLSWSGSVQAKSSVTLSFTVKVTATALGSVIESNRGTVNGLYLNKITNTVSAISLENLETVSDKADAIVEAGTEYDDPILMINALYRELLGKDLLSYSSISAALADIIDLTGKKVNPNSLIADMVMTNLSGGYLIRGTNSTNNDRIRAIRIEYLTVGDVIIAEHSTDGAGTVKRQVAYVYLGDGRFICATSDGGACTVKEVSTNDYGKIQNLLTSLYSYEKYAIIRPSMANTAE